MSNQFAPRRKLPQHRRALPVCDAMQLFVVTNIHLAHDIYISLQEAESMAKNTADGNAIAADILEALKEITHELQYQYNGCNAEDGATEKARIKIVKKCRAAIAKAEGK